MGGWENDQYRAVTRFGEVAITITTISATISPSTPTPSPPLPGSAMQRLLNLVGPMLALIIVVSLFAAAEWISGTQGNFTSVSSARLVGVQSVKIGIAALGMTLIII